MDDTIVISDSEDAEQDHIALKHGTAPWELEWADWDMPGTQDLIDLTTCDDYVIDLTGKEDSSLSPVRSCFQDMNVKLEPLGTYKSRKINSSQTKGRLSSETSEEMCLSGSPGPFNRLVLEYKDLPTKHTLRTTYSDTIFPTFVSNSVKNKVESPSYSIEGCLASKINMKDTLKNNFPSQGLLPACTSDDRNLKSEMDLPLSQPVRISTSIHSALKEEDPKEEPAAEKMPLNKALLYKLRYFKKPPVSHFFFHTSRHKKWQPKPIPLSRMNIVNNTMEESFHQGTLHFLANFVTDHYYPPKDIISHVIHSILLGAEEETIKHEAYMILMKVQKLHPATVDTVAWDWNLLSELMEKKESKTCCVFLQYVVQTLDDDFQLSLKRRSLQKSLCKTVLSCEQRFYNVKDIIRWLIDIVKSPSENDINNKELESSSEYERQRMVFLLQRMLSIAVEVDPFPVTSSNRIANEIFHYINDMKTRQQRQLFLCSTENLLLQAKILEVIFHSSCCKSLPSQDCSLIGKILFFISNSTLHLENQGPEWQTWEEMLHYICLLFLGLQKIKTGHLQISALNRIDETLRPHNQLFLSEEITAEDVEECLNTFQKRVCPEAEPPQPLKDRFCMLQSLLLAAVKKHT